MKKTTLIIIALIYVASIVIVSMFGLRAIQLKDDIAVIKIECVNETKGDVYVDDTNPVKKIIRKTFTEPGNPETLEGTVLQLEFRVYPDNATNKALRYDFARDQYPQIIMHEIDGRETGAMIFTGPALVTVTVYSTDGTGVRTEVLVSVR